MGILDLINRLSNVQLSVFDNWVIWMNFAGSASAYWFNRKASKMGLISLRKTHFLISGLAAFYTASYLFLLLFDPKFMAWSSFMRGVSLVVWPVVWAWPAVVSMRTWKKFTELLEIDEVEELEHLMRLKDDEDE